MGNSQKMCGKSSQIKWLPQELLDPVMLIWQSSFTTIFLILIRSENCTLHQTHTLKNVSWMFFLCLNLTTTCCDRHDDYSPRFIVSFWEYHVTHFGQGMWTEELNSGVQLSSPLWPCGYAVISRTKQYGMLSHHMKQDSFLESGPDPQ